MAAGAVGLPEGFTLDQPKASGLPDGFVLDQKPQGFVANAIDFMRSVPRGALSGLLSAGQGPSQYDADIGAGMGGEPTQAMTTPQMVGAVEKFTGPLPQPQGPAGRFGQSIGESLGNPVSYIGPGGLPMKVGSAILSGAGGQAGEETGLPGMRAIGTLAGGLAGAKALGPAAEKAAIPTLAELGAAKNQNYGDALKSGLELHPAVMQTFAAQAEQNLMKRFRPSNAGPTFDLLSELQNVPAGRATTTAADLNSIRTTLGEFAKETRAVSQGVFAPTPNAAAANSVLQDFKRLTENIPNLPQGSVVAGDPALYAAKTAEGNANNAAFRRVENFDSKTMRAENAANGGVATSLDNQLKSKSRQLLDNPSRTRGWSQDELDQLQLINDGTLTSNLMRQAGRGTNLGLNLAAAPFSFASGTWPYQLGMASAAGALKKGAEMMTKSRVNTLQDMLAQRSPLYQQRAANVHPWDSLPLLGSLGRSSILGLQ